MPDTADQLPDLPADWPNRSTSRCVIASGLRWHVQRAGTGPLVLLVHGSAGATHTWREILPLLTPWAEVVAIDLPGHGFTTGDTPDQLSLRGMAEALRELLRVLDVHPAIGVGHSAGAAVLLQLCSSREVAPQSVIGINSALVSLNALGQIFLPVSRALADVGILRAGAAALLRSGTLTRALLRSTGSPLDPEQEARYVALLSSERRVGATLRMMSRWDLDALVATFPTLTIPVTLVHSTNEPWVPFADLLRTTRTIPDRRVIDVSPAGHLIPDEQPLRVASIIRDTFEARPASPE